MRMEQWQRGVGSPSVVVKKEEELVQGLRVGKAGNHMLQAESLGEYESQVLFLRTLTKSNPEVSPQPRAVRTSKCPAATAQDPEYYSCAGGISCLNGHVPCVQALSSLVSPFHM